MLRVLVVPSWYASDEHPTLGSFFREQAEAISECGAEVRVAYCELRHPIRLVKDILGGKKTGLAVQREEALPVYRFTRYNLPPRNPESMDVRFAEGLVAIVERLLSEGWKPDVIHLQSFFPAGFGVLEVSKRYGIPFVLSEHSTGFSRQGWSPYQERILREVLRNAASIITVSRGLKNDVQQYTESEIKVIPNLVDFSKFQVSSSVFPPNDKFVFFSLGYLTHKKGFDILLKSFAQAFSQHESVELRIGGDGKELKFLRKLARGLGIEDKVHFLGALNREQVACEMNACHSFVLASRFETFGVVFIEALSVGKPIIVPDIDGPNDIVNEENGLIFIREDVLHLSTVMKDMYSNIRRYDSEEIKKSCQVKYDREVVGRTIYRVLNDSFLVR